MTSLKWKSEHNKKKICYISPRSLSTYICTTENVHLILREKCPYSELFWSVFSRIPIEYGEIQSISPYLVRMRENADQNNSEYEHFLRRMKLDHSLEIKTELVVENIFTVI